MNWFKKSFDKITGKTKRENEKRINSIKDELSQILSRVISDWNKSIYADKVSTIPAGHVKYKFENGDTIEIFDRTLIYKSTYSKTTYTLSYDFKNAFVQVFNKIITIINEGSVGERNSIKQEAIEDHPKRKLYNSLVENLTLRKEKLSTIPKTNDMWNSLNMEMLAVERKVTAMKKEYGF